METQWPHLPLVIALLGLSVAACGVRCPDGFTREENSCRGPDSGVDGATDAAMCSPECNASSFCFGRTCVPKDACTQAFGAPCGSLGPTYFKADNAGADDSFGGRVALSSDGNTLVVPAQNEQGLDNDLNKSGAVYVFRKQSGTWIQQSYLKADNAGVSDQFGYNVSVSGDGNTIAVGAWEEDSDTQGVNGDDNNGRVNSGAAYIFRFAAGEWEQVAYLKAHNAGMDDRFGTVVSLSEAGNVLAVSARDERSNGSSDDNDDAANAGAVYVFREVGGAWEQEAYLKATNAEAEDRFGEALAISGDGNVILVGAPFESSNGTTVGANQGNNDLEFAGAGYVYRYNGTRWAPDEYLKGSGLTSHSALGRYVALSTDGNVAAISAPGQPAGGAVYVFRHEDSTWREEARLVGSAAAAGDFFGVVSLDGTGDQLVVGTFNDDSSANGIHSVAAADNDTVESGAVYFFRRLDGFWSQQAYIKAPNIGEGDNFGRGAALSRDGTTLAVGASGEASAAMQINGDQFDDSASGAGAAFVYDLQP